MSETTRTDQSLAEARASEVGDALREAVTREADPVARALEESFAEVGRTITRELEQAARQGRLTMQGLVDDVLADLARLTAEQLVREPLERAVGGALSSVFGTEADTATRSRTQLGAALTQAGARGGRNA